MNIPEINPINDNDLLENVEDALHKDIEQLIREETNRRPAHGDRKSGAE